MFTFEHVSGILSAPYRQVEPKRGCFSMPSHTRSDEQGTLLQCFVTVAHVAQVTNQRLLLSSPRSADKPMSIGAWGIRLVAAQSTQVLGRPASLQWLDEPNADGMVGFIESLAVTLHVY